MIWSELKRARKGGSGPSSLSRDLRLAVAGLALVSSKHEMDVLNLPQEEDAGVFCLALRSVLF